MMDLAQTAAARWGLGHARLQFVAGRENQVYRVTDASGDHALRIKRPGYRERIELESELMWMAALDRSGILLPKPVPSLGGHLLEQVEGHLVDLLTWLPGQTLGTALSDGPASKRETLFRDLGRQMARLHVASDAWEKPGGFSRIRWDGEGLLGDSPVWGRFWEHPLLSVADRTLFENFRTAALRDLHRMQDHLDFGLIHADLVRENVLLVGDRIGMLDFDDGGWGFRAFDLATALLKLMDSTDYPVLRDALLQGYLGVRPIDVGALDLFLALRAVTYVGWIAPRLNEDSAQERSHRYVATARHVCQRYLSNQPDH